MEELEKEKSVLEKEANDLKSSLESAVDDAEKLKSAEEKMQKHITEIRKLKNEKSG